MNEALLACPHCTAPLPGALEELNRRRIAFVRRRLGGACLSGAVSTGSDRSAPCCNPSPRTRLVCFYHPQKRAWLPATAAVGSCARSGLNLSKQRRKDMRLQAGAALKAMRQSIQLLERSWQRRGAMRAGQQRFIHSLAPSLAGAKSPNTFW